MNLKSIIITASSVFVFVLLLVAYASFYRGTVYGCTLTIREYQKQAVACGLGEFKSDGRKGQVFGWKTPEPRLLVYTQRVETVVTQIVFKTPDVQILPDHWPKLPEGWRVQTNNLNSIESNEQIGPGGEPTIIDLEPAR